MTSPATDALSDSFAGWTIGEAIERTTDPDDLCVHEGEESALSWLGAALWQRLSSGELVASGRFGTPVTPAILIDPKEFSALSWSGSPSTNLTSISGVEVEVFDIRVFPVLRAPNAPDCLNGLSLSETFWRYVINDPEVAAFAKRVIKTRPSQAAVFLKAQAPGPLTDFHWPLDLTTSAIEYRFVDLCSSDYSLTPSAAISAVSEVLADRIAGLRDVLADGKVVAFGLYAQTGIEGPIGRLQWKRSGTSIDASNGDLCEGEDFRAVARWTGLSLRLPETPMPANQPPAVIAPAVVEAPRAVKAQIVTKEKCRLECIAWLSTMMSNREIVPRSRDDLWMEAQSKWPNKLSQRDFLKARDFAITSETAWKWQAPGRRPKSPHS
jgi:hypothetical protein